MLEVLCTSTYRAQVDNIKENENLEDVDIEWGRIILKSMGRCGLTSSSSG
jgi:hypothetical protein